MSERSLVRHPLAGVVLTAIAACGRVGFDAAGDAADAAQATPDAPLGDLSTFGTPVLVEELSVTGADDDDPELTADELEMYFTSSRVNPAAGGEIYRAVRSDRGQPWQPPTPVAELASTYADTQPTLCCDDLMIFFGSNRPPSLGQEDIYVSTRPSRAEAWSPPVRVDELSSSVYDAGGALRRDGLEIFFDTARVDGSRRLPHVATRTSTSMPWSTPQLVSLGTPATGSEVDPYLVGDVALLFSASRGAGSFDLWVARRPAPDQPFEAPEPILVANTTEPERDPWLSADGRTLYFARRNAAGDYDIMVSTR